MVTSVEVKGDGEEEDHQRLSDILEANLRVPNPSNVLSLPTNYSEVVICGGPRTRAQKRRMLDSQKGLGLKASKTDAIKVKSRKRCDTVIIDD